MKKEIEKILRDYGTQGLADYVSELKRQNTKMLKFNLLLILIIIFLIFKIL